MPSSPAPPSGPVPARPAPSLAELAAIVAAVEVAWPRPVVLVPEAGEPGSPWRWSGRWWTTRRGVAAERRRP